MMELALSGNACNAVSPGCPPGHDDREFMASTAVIQPKQGIGDVIWHLPFIRAIAATTPTRAVTFVTLPSTHAQELLQAGACVDRTLYFENRGSELKRGLDLVRLTAMLRQLRCDTIWILDKTL